MRAGGGAKRPTSIYILLGICRILQGITPNCGAKMAKFQTQSTPLTTVFSYCIDIVLHKNGVGYKKSE